MHLRSLHPGLHLHTGTCPLPSQIPCAPHPLWSGEPVGCQPTDPPYCGCYPGFIGESCGQYSCANLGNCMNHPLIVQLVCSAFTLDSIIIIIICYPTRVFHNVTIQSHYYRVSLITCFLLIYIPHDMELSL